MISQSQRRRRRRKKCPFCNRPFYPNSKTKYHQWACSKPECQKKRHDHNHARWEAKNPGYYHGRYENTKVWLNGHPGYLRTWRSKRRDIQDEIIANHLINHGDTRLKIADIQDEMEISRKISILPP